MRIDAYGAYCCLVLCSKRANPSVLYKLRMCEKLGFFEKNDAAHRPDWRKLILWHNNLRVNR